MLESVIYPILIALFAGTDVLTFVLWRKTKRRVEAQTKAHEIDTQQKAVDLAQDQYDYVMQQLTKYQTEYFALLDRVQTSARAHSEEIESKCNEIAELKSKVAYFRGIRCYRCDCSQRIREYQKPKNEEE